MQHRLYIYIGTRFESYFFEKKKKNSTPFMNNCSNISIPAKVVVAVVYRVSKGERGENRKDKCPTSSFSYSVYSRSVHTDQTSGQDALSDVSYNLDTTRF